ncbi:MAG TPA: hypothetical protein VFA07_04630 [Chthonomonadaceae bacterium]|nr:hypothetical protein [Chthonomonadaceae bacterium]
MTASRKKLLAGLVLLAVVCFYLIAWTGCHSAPVRPKESTNVQALRKEKKGGD